MHGFLSFSLFTVSSGAMDVSGLEGGGRGARAERWGKGGTLISCEERKKDLGWVSDQLSPHSQLPFSLFGLFARTSDCLSAQLVLEDPVLEAGLLAERWFSFSSLDQLEDFLFLWFQCRDLDLQPRSWLDITWPFWSEQEQRGLVDGSFWRDVAIMWHNIHAAPFGLALKWKMESPQALGYTLRCAFPTSDIACLI